MGKGIPNKELTFQVPTKLLDDISEELDLEDGLGLGLGRNWVLGDCLVALGLKMDLLES